MSVKSVILGIALALLLSACESGFVQDDIDNVKKDIKQQFEKKEGITVTDIQMIKESPKKLSGYAKLKIVLYGQSTEVMKSCTATMGEDNKYIWKCE